MTAAAGRTMSRYKKENDIEEDKCLCASLNPWPVTLSAFSPQLTPNTKLKQGEKKKETTRRRRRKYLDNYPPTWNSSFHVVQRKESFLAKSGLFTATGYFCPTAENTRVWQLAEMMERPISTLLQLNYSGWGPPPALGRRVGPCRLFGTGVEMVWHNTIAPASKDQRLIQNCA